MDSLYIADVDCTNYLRTGTPEMEFQLNTRSMFDLEFLDTSGMLRPALNDEVIYTIDERTLTVSGSAANPVITASVGLFAAGDVGKAIVIPGAGVAGAVFHAKIITFLSSSQVEAEFDLDTTVSSVTARVGFRRFWGFIQDADEEAFYADSGIKMRITCADFNAGPEQVLFNGISQGPTLRDHVDTSLISGTTSHWGIRRDPAMATGPTLGILGIAFKYVMEFWKDLSRLSGWVFVVDQFKVIRFFEVGTIFAPIDVTTDIILAQTLKINYTYNQYRNDQWVWYGGSNQFEYTDTGTGNGSQTRWGLTGAPVGGFPSRGYISLVEGGIEYNTTIGREGDGSGQVWSYNPLTNELVRSSAYGSGDTWSLTYLNQGPLVAHRDDTAGIAAHKLRGNITQVDSITTLQAAEDYADALLRRYSRTPRTITFSTYNTQLEVGQTVTVNLPNRGIAPIDFLIDSVTSRDDGSGNEDEHIIYEIHAIEGEEFQNLWIEFFRDQGGGSLGGSTGSPAPDPGAGNDPSDFPQVTGMTSRVTGSTNTYVIFFPDYNIGDLLLVWIGHSSHNDLSVSIAGSTPGWTEAFNDNVALSLPSGALYRKVATSLNEQLTITNATSNVGLWVAQVLTNAGTVEFSSPVRVNPQGPNTDPASLTPAGGSDDYLWYVFMMQTGGVSPTPSPPTGFGQMAQLVSGTTKLSLARREETAASKNPGAWTHGNTVTICWTVSVKPAT